MLKEKKIFWFAFLLLTFYFLYLVRDILLPFVIAFILAYFLDPVVRKLNSYRVPVGLSALLVLAAFFIILIVFVIMILPDMSEQINQFADNVPKFREIINTKFKNIINNIDSKFGKQIGDKMQELIQNISGVILNLLTSVLLNIWSSGIAIFNLISLIVITPIITFYLLKDWSLIVAKISSLVPLGSRNSFKNVMKQIDEVLSGFLRGQINVCLILACYYSVALSLLGLNFALFVGITSGILAFIPYLGVAIGAFIALMIAFFQFYHIHQVLLVIFVFLFGQFCEGNFITPKLVGEKIGLHPAWLFFLLLAGGAIFGFVGVLFAVPVGAIIGVLVREIIKLYLASNYFKQ